MKSYFFWMQQARRCGACVDYGSPCTAWTPRMFDILRECGGDKLKATEKLQKERAEARKNLQEGTP